MVKGFPKNESLLVVIDSVLSDTHQVPTFIAIDIKLGIVWIFCRKHLHFHIISPKIQLCDLILSVALSS